MRTGELGIGEEFLQATQMVRWWSKEANKNQSTLTIIHIIQIVSWCIAFEYVSWCSRAPIINDSGNYRAPKTVRTNDAMLKNSVGHLIHFNGYTVNEIGSPLTVIWDMEPSDVGSKFSKSEDIEADRFWAPERRQKKRPWMSPTQIYPIFWGQKQDRLDGGVVKLTKPKYGSKRWISGQIQSTQRPNTIFVMQCNMQCRNGYIYIYNNIYIYNIIYIYILYYKWL